MEKATKKLSRRRKKLPPPKPVSIVLPVLFIVAGCALAGWAAKSLRGADPIPAMAVVATVLLTLGWVGGAFLKDQAAAFSGQGAVALIGVGFMAFTALGIQQSVPKDLAVTAGEPGTTGSATAAKPNGVVDKVKGVGGDPLADGLLSAYKNALGGKGTVGYEPQRFEEGRDTARHFLHAYLSGDKDHMKAFAVLSLHPAIDKVTLPAPVIKDPSAVALDALRVTRHDFDPSHPNAMLIELEYGGTKRRIRLVRDMAWLVNALP